MATVKILDAGYGYEVLHGKRLQQYDRFEDMPLSIRKPLALLMICPGEVEYIKNVGRVMGTTNYWIYKPSKQPKEK